MIYYVQTHKLPVCENIGYIYGAYVLLDDNGHRTLQEIYHADDIQALAEMISADELGQIHHVWNPETRDIDETGCLSLAECMELTLEDLN